MIRTKRIRDYRLEYAALTIIPDRPSSEVQLRTKLFWARRSGMRFGFLVGRNEPEGPKYTFLFPNLSTTTTLEALRNGQNN